MNAAQNQTRAVSLSFYTLQKTPHTHILSYQKLSISFSGRRLVCHFLSPRREQNQEVCERLRPRMQPESPLSLGKQEASCGPAPIQATSPLLHLTGPQHLWQPIYKAPHQGPWRPQTGSRKHESLGKEFALLLSCGPVCFTPHRGQRKTASPFRHIKTIWLCLI